MYIYVSVLWFTISVPGAVKAFNVTNIKPYEVTLQWQRPNTDDSLVQGYTIEYKGNKTVSLTKQNCMSMDVCLGLWTF